MDERDRRVDGVRRRHPEANRDAESESQLVPVEHVGRVCDGHEQRLVRKEADGYGRVSPREVLGQQQGRSGVHVGLLELDERHLDLLREQARNLCLRHASTLDEDLAQPLARVTLRFERVVELFFCQEAVADEQRPQRRPWLMSGFHPVEISACHACDVSRS